MSFYTNLSARRKSALDPFVEELGQIKAIENLADLELPSLLNAIFSYEVHCASSSIKHFASHERSLQEYVKDAYIEEWTQGFLDTIYDWRTTVRDYAGAVSKYEMFRKSLPSIETKFIEHAQQHNHQMWFVQSVIENKGYDARKLGEIEASLQLRQLIQLFYARYSAETIERTEEAYQRRSRQPQPSLSDYMFKERRRGYYMKSFKVSSGQWQNNNALFLALYLNRIFDAHDKLKVWGRRSEPLYMQQMLLLPGLPEANDLINKAMLDYNDLSEACFQLRKEFNSRRDKLMGMPSNENISTLNNLWEQRFLIELRNRPSLCLMSGHKGFLHIVQFKGESWSTRGICDLLSPPLVFDVYTPGEISYDWPPLLLEWKKEAFAAEQRKREEPALPYKIPTKRVAAVKKPVPPKPILTEEDKRKAEERERKAVFRREAREERLAKRQEAYLAARQEQTSPEALKKLEDKQTKIAKRKKERLQQTEERRLKKLTEKAKQPKRPTRKDRTKGSESMP